MKYILLIISALAALPVSAQKDISVADIYQQGTFRQKSVYGINWMNDGRYYSAQEGNDILKYDITTGESVETILDGDALQPAVNFRSYTFSNDESKLLLLTDRESIYRRSYTAEYYVYDLKAEKLTKLSDNGKQAYATFSPDGSKVAFVRDNNLFYVSLADMKETQITNDGKFNELIHGSTDWVYEEELSFTRAFEWSGDGEQLFYLTFDESGVREYNMQKWNKGELYPEDYKFKYPKAGEDNSKVTATIYNLADGKANAVDLGTDQEYYVARIYQTQNDNVLSLMRLNRLQNQLDILHVDTKTGSTTTVLTEKYDTYVDLDFIDDLTYLKDGKHFVHSSEKSGYKHLYLYTIDGKLKNQITSGDWEVSSFEGVDESSRRPVAYFTSTEISPLDRTFYSIELSGKNKKTLRGEEGVHGVNMSSDYKYYIDYYSSAKKPLNVSLYQTGKNKLVKVLEDNASLEKTVKDYALSPKEFFTYKTVDGTDLNGYMIKPTDFDENKEYPVLVYQYSGPGSQQVMNSWNGGNYYWHQMLAQDGYIVAVIDTRGTGGRGAEFKKLTYKQLGKYESEDHIAGAKYLGNLPYVDESRIGIWGWSYGGYMSSLAMFKGEGLFKAAIAVAPVTNWRFYDTIYTERYMDTPQNNASGYDDNSPTSHVDKLNGNYLLIHGTGDDNVHFQNAVTLQNALIAAGKQFDSFYYPDRAHGIYRDNARMHLYTMMTDWLKENL
ncbi:S9 family peptidase [Fulvivirga sp. RKSG066]|uniref:DPP IV N-terminal domain-containing protein n=1 Tax=Fulvivirga aurantia TaxID=2529383 RepID=UPI0012BC7883|nr:DPP IV N-terminal domain-containing protein [Fulvivirga aurantia]MTI22665.1 S9 family peptidase [Fulvivirga aurantia]